MFPTIGSFKTLTISSSLPLRYIAKKRKPLTVPLRASSNTNIFSFIFRFLSSCCNGKRSFILERKRRGFRPIPLIRTFTFILQRFLSESESDVSLTSKQLGLQTNSRAIHRCSSWKNPPMPGTLPSVLFLKLKIPPVSLLHQDDLWSGPSSKACLTDHPFLVVINLV